MSIFRLFTCGVRSDFRMLRVMRRHEKQNARGRESASVDVAKKSTANGNVGSARENENDGRGNENVSVSARGRKNEKGNAKEQEKRKDPEDDPIPHQDQCRGTGQFLPRVRGVQGRQCGGLLGLQVCLPVPLCREGDENDEDEEEIYERRKLERKLRDKEAAYQEVGFSSLSLLPVG